MTFRIEKVAIIGAGTMGGGIAAHLANIGIPVTLLDIPTPNLAPAEAANPAARNKLVNSLYQRMIKAKPANLARKDKAELITIGNTEDDFDALAEADWIIEVIIEQLGPKQALMDRIAAVRKPGSIISSNTSGIPIGQIAAGQSEEFKAHFLGTHFFNPPRYLQLLEVIPTAETAAEVLAYMVDFGRDVLGKGVVVCKDTPNFIGNRFFAVAASYGINYAFAHNYSVAEVDNITGPLIGRPKTATFRLLDLVGLDVMGHVNRNLYEAIPHDPYRDVLKAENVANVMEQMLANKWLGNKVGQGFYKKTFVDGKREFWTLNPQTMAHEPTAKVRIASVGAVRRISDLGQRLQQLLAQPEDRAVTYARDLLYYGFAYAAQVAPEIAYKLSDVDDAMRWGFSHEAGPFQMWDMLGVVATAEHMEAAGLEVAPWVKEMLAAGNTSFYDGDGCYDWESHSYQPLAIDQKSIVISGLYAEEKEVARNGSASLLDMGDGVLLFEFHSKMNAIDQDIIAMGHQALGRLDSDFDALVIGNDADNFCVGANLFAMGVAAASGQWEVLSQMIRQLQSLTYSLMHAPKPVVTAVQGMALGGGVEMAVAGWETVAAHESYMGLVEFGAGLIPAGGGSTEMVRRLVNPVMGTPHGDVLPVLQKTFEQIALAKVGTSAWENQEMGYLRSTDMIAMNKDHLLARAKQRALQLAASGARPPQEEKIYAAGRDALAAIKLAVQSLVWGGYASEHDKLVATKLAFVLTGGDISAPAWVDPWYMLDLEREAFLSLIGEQKTRDRMTHLLQTGKPLRN